MLSWHGQVRVRQRGMTLKIPQTNPRYQAVTGNTLCLLSGPLIYKILRLMGFQRETRYALNMDSMSGVHATCLVCMWILSKEFGVFGLGKWFFCCWFITGTEIAVACQQARPRYQWTLMESVWTDRQRWVIENRTTQNNTVDTKRTAQIVSLLAGSQAHLPRDLTQFTLVQFCGILQMQDP